MVRLPAAGGVAGMKEARPSFLKKRSKKLLLTRAGAAWTRDAPRTCGSGTLVPTPAVNQKFFASFFQKRSAFLSSARIS
jgi:hypothetical protein